MEGAPETKNIAQAILVTVVIIPQLHMEILTDSVLVITDAIPRITGLIVNVLADVLTTNTTVPGTDATAATSLLVTMDLVLMLLPADTVVTITEPAHTVNAPADTPTTKDIVPAPTVIPAGSVLHTPV